MQPLTTTAFTVALLASALVAQTPKPELVKDINQTAASSGGSNPTYARNYPGGIFDATFLRKLPNVFFAASTTKYGQEPYMSNGTQAGTVMLGDINPGASSSSPYDFTLSTDGKKLFFRANDGTNGTELWVCDLTVSPPKCSLVADLNPGSVSSTPSYLCALGSNILFYALTPATGYELFISDGTAAGTKLLKDLNPGTGHGYPRYLKANNKGDKVFFYGTDGSSGYEPWVTDGTTAGTMMIKDVNPGSASSSPSTWQDIGDTTTTKMIFVGNNGTNGSELWITDGSAAGTNMVADVYPGTSSGSYITYSVVVNGELYFRGNDGTSGYEIWKTDGTAAGTKLVFDANPGSSSGYFYYPVVVNNKIYYRCTDGTNGDELWVHDPAATTNPTHMVADINVGSNSSSPTYLAPTLTGKFFFYATTAATGYELHVSDGTAAGTMLVKDIYPGTASGYAYYIAETTPGRVCFRSNDGQNGNELWSSDGTAANTVRIPLETQTVKKTNSANVLYIEEMNGKVYFSANDGVNGYELWSSDGTAAGTTMVKDIVAGSGSSYPYYKARLGNKILFRATDGSSGYELWETDGTAAGTKMLIDIRAGSGSSSPQYLQRIGDKVFFNANNGTNGYELYVTDGTAAGTKMLRDAYTGTGSGYGYHLAMLPNGKILCGYTRDTSLGYEMTVTDGTTAGTSTLDLVAGSGSSYPRYLTYLKGKVYFSANTGSGYELHVTDGTVAGTSMVKDVYPGASSSYWYYLCTDGNLLYGYCNDGQSGYELWASDGTAAGTKRLADIYAGSSSSGARYHSPIGSRHVYFQATDGNTGYELYRWDGTNVQSWDIWPGSSSSNPYNYSGSDYRMEPMNGYAYFRAQDPNLGYELYKFKNGATATDSYPDCSNIRLSGTDPLINSTAKINLENPNPSPISVLLVGPIAAKPFTLPGSTCPLFVDVSSMFVIGVSVKASDSFSLPIPNDNALEGGNVVFQVVDVKGLPASFSTSNPLQWTISTL